MKLLVMLLMLVVLPTAWFGLLAGRAMQARETRQNQRLETEAQETFEEIGNNLFAMIQAAKQDVAALVQQTLLEGPDMAEVSIAWQPLREGLPFVETVYLFLDSDGFRCLYAAPRGKNRFRDQHVFISRDFPMRMPRRVTPPRFSGNHDRSILGRWGRSTRLYAGFQIEQDRFIEKLERKLESYSTAHITYRLLRVSALEEREHASEKIRSLKRGLFRNSVFISVPYLLPERRDDALLLAARLHVPFADIKIGAFDVHADETFALRARQLRLVHWSMLLFALVLISSVAILIWFFRKQSGKARIRSIFIAGLSHDIRTPVTAMRALAESLEQGRVASPERQQQFLHSIVDECDRLQALIDRVFLFFRQEQGKDFQKQPINLVTLCEKVSQTFRGRYREHIDLHLDLPKGQLPVIYGDPTAIEQVLHNLLENAWKYGRSIDQHPGQSVVILVRLKMKSNCPWRRCIHISVEDAGPGIAAGDKRKIFRRFYRGHSGLVEQLGGIGLGLALVWEIVRSHGGKVDVGRSSLGGACFVLRFRPYRSFLLSSWKEVSHRIRS